MFFLIVQKANFALKKTQNFRDNPIELHEYSQKLPR